MTPLRMKAAVTTGPGGVVNVRKIDVPKVGPTEVLVKVVAAASNPTDWKTITYSPSIGNVVGLDFAGTVEEIGSEVPAGKYSNGQRVAGAVHGAAFPNGAFAEYVVALGSAAQLGVAGYTACICLYQAQSLPSPLSPAKEPVDLLVWGGSSSVGQFVIQLAHLSGLRVLATSSPRNFPLLKSLGADLVFSYADPETPEKIRKATGGKLVHAVDCISEKDTPGQVARAIGDAGGIVSAIVDYESHRPDVQVKLVLGYHLFGKDLEIPVKLPLDIAVYEFGPQAAKILTETLKNGSLKPGPIKIMPNGLASVNDGFAYLRDGKVSGEKLVYRIALLQTEERHMGMGSQLLRVESRWYSRFNKTGTEPDYVHGQSLD